MTVAELRALLGHDVLLLPWPKGSKGTAKKWGHLTIASMPPAYLEKLENGNVGVALGEVSGNLVALDVDDHNLVEPLLGANAFLNCTLQTHGARGRVFWLRMTGAYPHTIKRLKTRSGRDCGEWRAGKNSQSIIHGIHPDTGNPYQVVNNAKPLAVDFADIVWPPEISNPPTLNSASCISASLPPCVSTYTASLHNNAEAILANISARADAQAALAANHPQLARLYARFIEWRFQAAAHARNQFIVQAVPFLYRAVASKFVVELVGCWYDCNRAIFRDTRERHLTEAAAMLEAVAKSYVESLNEGDRKIYDTLTERERDTFRICRDLASLKTPKREPQTFYLSFDHLGDRLGIHPTQAQRIMRQLEDYGLIKLLKKGTRRAAGVRGEAGEYKWLL